jgi:hypothetical protein
MTRTKRKGGLVRKLTAVAAGAVAAKFAMKAVEQLWKKGFRSEPPRMVPQESKLRKAAWVGLTAAGVGVARQLTRDAVAPKARRGA